MDKQYWQDFYKKAEVTEEPSQFARFVADQYYHTGNKIIELGCGNGRDARFFGSVGARVTAIDQAGSEIDVLQSNNTQDSVEYIEADFTRLDQASQEYDLVYSRFTLHSVSAMEQERTLAWANRALKIGGFLCIEARGCLNSLYQQGTPVEGEPDAFIHDEHYRRFLSRETLDGQIGGLGLQVDYSVEDTGFAPFGDEDDYFIRHISQKTS